MVSWDTNENSAASSPLYGEGTSSDATTDSQACSCNIRGVIAELNDSLRGKMLILEDLNFTIEEKKKIEDKFDEVQDANRKLEEKVRKIEEEKKKIQEEKMALQEEKMKMELHLADIVDDYKCKTEATRMKVKKIKKYAMEKEMHLHYALGAIIILVIIVVAMYGLSRCTR